MHAVLKVLGALRLNTATSGLRLATSVSLLCFTILFLVCLWLPSQSYDTDELEARSQTKIVIVTATSRPHYLSRSFAHVDRLRHCFDVQWIIVHTMERAEMTAAPFFRDVFPWIKELRSFHDEPSEGGNERNIAIRFIGEHLTEGDGFVYYADDDNVLPDLCGLGVKLRLQHFYVADQSSCGTVVISTQNKDWSRDILEQIACKMPSGSFVVPLALVRETSSSILWSVKHECGSDARYFTALMNVWIRQHGASSVRRLPLSLNFHHISDQSGCVTLPWTEAMLRESHDEFKQLLGNMTEAQKRIAPSNKQKQTHVSFHSYVHILSTIRAIMPRDRPIHYLEIGVWKGATSLLMSRHRYPTTVTGIDTFQFRNQRTEAEMIKQVLQGSGPIQWIPLHSSSALNATRESLQRLGATAYDILFFDGDYSTPSLFYHDFVNYSSLVAPGGFIVVDDFLETKGSHGVRETIWNLVRDGFIEAAGLDILGVVANGAVGAGHEFKKGFVYDWQASTSNDFVFRKRA